MPYRIATTSRHGDDVGVGLAPSSCPFCRTTAQRYPRSLVAGSGTASWIADTSTALVSPISCLARKRYIFLAVRVLPSIPKISWRRCSVRLRPSCEAIGKETYLDISTKNHSCKGRLLRHRHISRHLRKWLHEVKLVVPTQHCAFLY